MKYFDAHCHIQFAEFEEDRTALLESMKDSEVGGLIVGTDRTSSKNAVDLADGKTLFASIGLHPNDKPKEGYEDAYYQELAKDSRVVAIGECGLDYFRPEDPESEKARQKDVFARHIALAVETQKPLMIHARPSKGSMDAYLDAYEMLKSAKQEHGDRLQANMHFYVGDVETTKKLLELDFTFSFTAVLTFSKDYDDVVRYIPLTNLLSETDAPYVAPAPNRGKRNDPRAIPKVIEAMARIRGVEEEVVRAAILENSARVFSIPIPG